MFKNTMKKFLLTSLSLLLGNIFYISSGHAEQLIVLDGLGNTPVVINDQAVVVGRGGTSNAIAQRWNNGALTSLGTLGGSSSYPSGINNAGKVVGSSYLAGDVNIRAFLWQNGQMVDLLGVNGQATAINNLDQIVGTYASGAFLWQNGVVTNLAPTSSGFSPSSINDVGQIVGTAKFAGFTRGAIWQNGTLSLIGFLDSNKTITSSPKINNSGQIIETYIDGGSRTMFWQNGVVTQILPTNAVWAYANGINNLGQVVGFKYDPTSVALPYIWTNNTTTYFTGALGIQLVAVNNNGQAVGGIVGGGCCGSNVAMLTVSNLQNQSDATTPYDETIHPDCPCNGMAIANAHAAATSLNLGDTPVGYRPALGPDAYVRLTYDHRTTSQPATFNYFNVGPKWTLNLLSYIQDDPNLPGNNVTRYVDGGGSVDYAYESGSYISSQGLPTSGNFGPELKSHAVLKRTPSVGAVTSYELTYPDGSKQVFGKLDGATTKPRRVFLTKTVDQAGNALTYNYDSSLRLTSMTDAAGRNTTFTYGNANPLLVTQITDPFGRFSTLAYDGTGRLASITDVVGITSSFTYDTTDPTFIKSLTTPYGTSNFSFSQNTTVGSRALELTDPMGYAERLEFMPNAPGIAANETALPTGTNIINGQYNVRNSFYWDKHALPIARPTLASPIDYTKAQITHWLQNKAGQTSAIAESKKQPLENRVYFNYPGQTVANVEGSLNLPSVIARVLDNGSTQLSQATYNSLGKVLTSIDPIGRKTTFAYDSTYNIDLQTIKQQTAADGTLTTVSSLLYNTQHKPTSNIDAATQTTRYGYNPAGQMQSTTNPLNQSVVYTYDTKGRIATTKNDYNVVVQTFTYPLNCDTTNPTHLNCDLPTSVTDSEGRVVSYLYDALDRVTKITYPDGTHDDYDYKFQNGTYIGTQSLDLRKVTDRLGRIKTYTYDANRRLTSVTEPLTTSTTRTTQYAYYENGTLKNLTDANGSVTHSEIDLQSRPISKTYAYGTASAQTESNVYETTTSRTHRITDTAGQIKEFAYGADDQISNLYYVWTVNPTGNISYSYDPYWPRLTSMTTEDTGTTTYTYVPPGTMGALQVATEDGPFLLNDVISYGYDAVGRMSSRNMAGGNETFLYDRLGRLTTHGTGLGSFLFNYLGQTGQVASRSVLNAGITITTNWGYDTNANDRRLKTVTNSGVSRSYTLSYLIPGTSTNNPYDIQGITDTAAPTHPYSSQTWQYTYDNADRLLTALSGIYGFTYTYDKLDNVASVVTSTGGNAGFGYNALNQRNGLGYDAAGNMNDTYWQFRQLWDGGDRLAEADFKTAPGASTYTAQKTQFAYDGQGRRITDTGTPATGAATITNNVWCGDVVCQVLNASGNVIRRYYAEGEVWPVVGTKMVFMPDHLGSVRDAINPTTGALVWTSDYEPYGNNLRSTSVAGSASPDYRYAGMLYQWPLQRYLTRYRVYDPGAILWNSRDPIREAGGINLYGYVGGNPINAVDPLGLETRSYIDPRDPAFGVNEAFNPPNVYSVGGHGNPNDGTYISSRGDNASPSIPAYRYSVDRVARDIVNGDTKVKAWDRKQPIYLAVCDAWESGFALNLANAVSRLVGYPVPIWTGFGNVIPLYFNNWIFPPLSLWPAVNGNPQK